MTDRPPYQGGGRDHRLFAHPKDQNTTTRTTMLPPGTGDEPQFTDTTGSACVRAGVIEALVRVGNKAECTGSRSG